MLRVPLACFAATMLLSPGAWADGPASDALQDVGVATKDGASDGQTLGSSGATASSLFAF